METQTRFIKNNFIRIMTSNAIVAALYVVLTLITLPLSFGYMQIRISEFLMLLAFFNPWYTIGLTLGCFLANVFSTVGPIDMLLGTLATFLACVLMNLVQYLIKSLLVSAFIPCLVNAFIVPFIIYISAGGEVVLTADVFFMMAGFVFLGEFIAIIVIGYPIFMILTKRVKKFHQMILTTRNFEYKF